MMKKLKLSFPKSQIIVENGVSDEELIDYTFKEKSHALALLAQLHNLQEASEQCDVVLEVNDVKINAHRNVLAVCSSSFKYMFQDADVTSDSTIVKIKGIEAETLKLLVNYAYTGNIKITESNCRCLISASYMLQVLTVRNAACEFLKRNINYNNCCEIFVLAETHDCTDLRREALKVIVKNFASASKQEAFLNFSVNSLIELLSVDELETETEQDVFSAVQRWFEHNPENRTNDLHKVLQAVRLPLLDLEFITNCTDSLTVLKTNPKCLELIENAKSYHSTVINNPQIFNKQTKPRSNFDIMQLILTVDGETIKGFCPVAEKWYHITELPVTKKTGTIVSYNNNLYVANNVIVKNKLKNRIWRYDPFANTWHDIAVMAISRSNFGLASVGRFIYAIAGRDTERKCLDSVEQYNPETNCWTFIPKLKNCTANAAVTGHNGMLYVAGGVILKEGVVVTNSFSRYDPTEKIWTDLLPMSGNRFGAAICVLNDYIYVIGGCASLTSTSNRMERYDVKNNCWTKMSSMNERRFEPGISVMYNRIYILGGRSQTDNNKYHDTVECYEPETDKWKIIAKLPSSCLWLSCVPLKIKKSFCQEVESNRKL